MKKKPDLQGLRGVAITSVILFHFFPSSFPNGYVGVDQFFVLSGYLMTLIFGSREITRTSIAQFYYRRIKRILPLYVTVIIIAYLLMFVALPPTFRGLNKETATRAALLMSNMAKAQTDNDYFVLLEQAADLFTHTWSLSCELQFYLLAPPMFLLFSLTFGISLGSFCLIFLFSLGLHLFSDSQTSFNSVFCRMWQFQIGMAAFYCGNSLDAYLEKMSGVGENESLLEMQTNDDEDVPKIHVKRRTLLPIEVIFWPCLFGLIVCSFCPFLLPSKIIRPVSTIVAGVVILLGTHVEQNPLNFGKLVYLGDVSYSLYLIHWPMFVWVKYYFKDIIHDYFITIALGIILAVVVTESYEKWYQTLDGKKITALLTMFYIVLASLLLNTERIAMLVDGQTSMKAGVLSKNVTKEEAIQMNIDYDKWEYPNLVIKNCLPNSREHGFCSFNNGDGNNRILILGNSYTANLAPLVNDVFKRIGSNISKYSNSYCEVLTVDTTNSDFGCKESYQNYKKIAEDFQPDILFLIARTYKSESLLDISNIAKDAVLQEMINTLEEYQKLVKKKIYILKSVPRVLPDHIRKLNEFIKENKPEQANSRISQTFLNGQKRLDKAMEVCKKCRSFDFNSVFTNSNGTVRLFDPHTRLSYFTSGAHITAAGMDAVRPIFKQLADTYED